MVLMSGVCNYVLPAWRNKR